MASGSHSGQPSRKKYKGAREDLRDMKGCAVGCYIWEHKLPIMVDTLVLGNSLQEHGVKAQKLLCINKDTLENTQHDLGDEGWLAMEDHLREHARYMMEMHSQPEWKGKIEQFLREAYLEWFDAWKRTYVNVVNYVLETAYNKMVCTRTDDGDHVRCPCCESSGTPRSWKRILTSFEITFSSIDMCWPWTSRFLSNTR